MNIIIKKSNFKTQNEIKNYKLFILIETRNSKLEIQQEGI